MRSPQRTSVRLAASIPVLLLVISSQAVASVTLSVDYLVNHVYAPSGLQETFADHDEAGGINTLQASLSFDRSIDLASIQTYAQGGLIGPAGQLRLQAFSTATADSWEDEAADRAGYSTAVASSAAVWSDFFTIRDLAGTSATSALLVVNFDGSTSIDGLATAAVTGSLAGSFATGVQRDAPGTLTLEIHPDINGRFDWTMSLSLYASGLSNPFPHQDPPGYQTAHAEATADFFHTMTLGALLVQDSNGDFVTPESLGDTLTFGSGMASPNLVGVPEPSSVVMLGFGAIGLIGAVVRRKRASA